MHRPHALSQSRPQDSFSIPHPSLWKEKFLQETSAMSCSEIAEKYLPNLQKLSQYDILSPSQKRLLSAASLIHSEIRAFNKECQAEYERQVAPKASICHQTKLAAQMAYDSHEAHRLLQQVDEERRNEMREIETGARNALNDGHPPETVEKEKAKRIQSASDRYARLKRSIEAVLQTELRKKDLACANADEDFYFSTKGERQEKDWKIRAYQALRTPQIRHLNAEHAVLPRHFRG